MKNFGIGLALGILGGVIAFITLNLNIIGEVFGAGDFPFAGFLYSVAGILGIGGPVTFWIILPIINRLRR